MMYSKVMSNHGNGTCAHPTMTNANTKPALRNAIQAGGLKLTTTGAHVTIESLFAKMDLRSTPQGFNFDLFGTAELTEDQCKTPTLADTWEHRETGNATCIMCLIEKVKETW